MEDDLIPNQKRSTQPSNDDWVDLLLNAVFNLITSNTFLLPLNSDCLSSEENEVIFTESFIVNRINLYLSSKRQKIKTKYQNALVQAIMEIGGKQCFPHFKTRQLVPMDIVYPLSGGRGLWHVRDPRCKVVCETLRQMIDFVEKSPAQLPTDPDYVNRIIASSSFEDINNAFMGYISRNIGGIPKDIPHFEKHLQRCLLTRSLYLLFYSFS